VVRELADRGEADTMAMRRARGARLGSGGREKARSRTARVFLATTMGVLALAPGARAGAEEREPATVEVSARLWADTSLYFTVELKRPRSVDVPLDSLPWGAYPDLHVVVVRADDGVVLPRPAGPESTESPVTRLVSGRPLHGRVPLTAVAEGAEEARRASDLIVFWSFRLRIPGTGFSNRTGGWVAVPRTR
jgi:hypothetical protein